MKIPDAYFPSVFSLDLFESSAERPGVQESLFQIYRRAHPIVPAASAGNLPASDVTNFGGVLSRAGDDNIFILPGLGIYHRTAAKRRRPEDHFRAGFA